MKTTKEDFKLFKQYCREWQKKLGLGHWKIYFEHEEYEDGFACSWTNNRNTAHIRLARTWPGVEDLVKKDKLYDSARHEMLHILLAKITIIAERRFTQQEELLQAEEETVRLIESFINSVWSTDED